MGIRWAGHVARIGEMRSANKTVVGKLEGKRQLEKIWRRWKDNIKLCLNERGYKSADCIKVT